MSKIGTADFYYQAAEDLEKLGVEFVILIKEPGSPSTICINNVESTVTANSMYLNLKTSFDRQFP